MGNWKCEIGNKKKQKARQFIDGQFAENQFEKQNINLLYILNLYLSRGRKFN